MKEGEAKVEKRRKLRNLKMASFQGRALDGVVFRASNFVNAAKTFTPRDALTASTSSYHISLF